MKRVFSTLLILCMVSSMLLPTTAFAADTETGLGYSESVTESVPEAAPGTTEDMPEATPTEVPEANPGEAPPEGGSIETPEEYPGDIPDEPMEPAPDMVDGGPVIAPFSEFVGEGSEYYTKIRLTVTDRQGNPLSGAVYGLYKTNGSFVEYLTTDYSGVAVSNDVPVDTDYYLVEITPPAGYAPNTGRKDIILSEVCAPSRIDITVEYDPIMGRIEVVKTDEYGSALPSAGFYVYNESTGQLVDIIITGQDGSALTTELPYGWYELYEYLTPEGYDGGGYYMARIEYEGETATVYVTNQLSRAYVQVYKTGEDERKIQGAVFSIYTAGGEWVEDVTTNSGGYAYSNALVLGEYYLIEKSVPEGYKIDAEPHYFTLSYSWQTVYIDLVNERDGNPGRLKIIKTDENENPLSGVVFGLYRAWDGKKLAELTTGAEGVAEYGPLIPQDYYLVELVGKDGYESNGGQIAFTIEKSGTTAVVVVVNPKAHVFGKIKAVKQDDAGNPLPGVRFGLYCAKGNLLQEMVTGADGTATSGILNAGDYYLVELAGIPGYVADTGQHPITISQNNVTVPITIINPRITGSVKVIKTGDGGEPLSGVVFGIYKDGGKITELTTGQDGTATSGAMYYGAYELRELSTVAGYELLDISIPFSILTDGAVIEIPVTNPLIYGGVSILKTDESGAPLYGAVFGLYRIGQEQPVMELTTGEDGRAETSGLVMGDYVLREHAAPEGFAPIEEDIPLSVTAQGEVIAITVPNVAGSGIIRVVKYGEGEITVPNEEVQAAAANYAERLPGVVFEVYRASDNEYVTIITTDENGEVEVTLPLGAYYLLEKQTAEGYRLPEGGFSFSLTEHGATVELSIQNQKEPEPPAEPDPGAIKVIKKAEGTGALLTGAVFALHEANSGLLLATITTGADGVALYELPEGSYYLVEQTAPAGFQLTTAHIGFAVKTGETVEVVVTNAPIPTTPTTGQIKLIKKAESTGALLTGAVFGVYDAANDIKITELTTGANGEAVSGELPAGAYYLREIKAPSGFILSTEKTGATVKAGETVTITITNTPTPSDEPDPPAPGTVKVTKKAEDTDKRLSGAVFAIYRASNDKKVAEITTGKNGTASYELEAGRYYLVERTAPEGYKLNTDKISFTIKSGETKEINVTNTPKDPDAPDIGSLYLVKKAEGTGARLPGAVFGVYKTSGNAKVTEITTDSDGEALCDLEPGSYYLRELKAPSGYVLESVSIPFTVKVDSTVRVEVTNMRQQANGNVKLVKRGPDGETVSGAVFGIYKASDNSKVSEITTGSDGTAFHELAPGAYYLLEKTAPTGYVLNTDKHSFTVTSGQTVEVRVINQRTAPAPNPTPPGVEEIPKTGEAFPYGSYALAALFMALAMLCAVMLYRGRGQRGITT